jgi:Xaa-Pro aminopeptidase
VPPVYTTAREEREAHPDEYVINAGEFLHVDTGAEFNHYSADVQRMVPVDGRFTDEQKKVYAVVLAAQKAAIGAVKPGATWWDVHNTAVKILRDAGGWDKSYTYGIGHFVGMDVHDHGDYLKPLEPGMVLTIEQGVVVNNLRVALEDDVLVTPTGQEWLSRFIPIEIDEVEKLRTEAVSLDLSKLLLSPRR